MQFEHQSGTMGSGLALAARAGAVLRDLEFVQFDPTAIATPRGVRRAARAATVPHRLVPYVW